MVKEVHLTQGKIALVDDADYERVMQFRWNAAKLKPDRYYAATGGGPRAAMPTLYMHRFIIHAPAGVYVDHINGNSLDNRRCNLRLVSPAQNQYNRRPSKNSTSGFKGVTKDNVDGKWVAQINFKRRKLHIGKFESPKEAALAYDRAAIELYGAFAYLNFPEEEHKITGSVLKKVKQRARYRHRLTIEEAKAMREMYQRGVSQKKISEIFNLSKSQVNRIILNRQWKE